MLGRMGVSYPAGGGTVAARMLLDHILPIQSCVKMSRDRAQSSRAQSRKVELLLGWAGMGLGACLSKDLLRYGQNTSLFVGKNGCKLSDRWRYSGSPNVARPHFADTIMCENVTGPSSEF